MDDNTFDALLERGDFRAIAERQAWIGITESLRDLTSTLRDMGAAWESAATSVRGLTDPLR